MVLPDSPSPERLREAAQLLESARRNISKSLADKILEAIRDLESASPFRVTAIDLHHVDKSTFSEDRECLELASVDVELRLK